MLQNYNKYKVLKVFLDSPLHGFQLREISRLAKIAPTSVKKYLEEFQKKDIIRKSIKKNYTFYMYKANRENEEFIFLKKVSTLIELNYSGLIEYLWENLSPEAIILYGSYVRGEAIDDSDIDLFIIGNEKKLELKKYEKLIGKKIHLMFKKRFNLLNKELKNNLINGIILKGYLEAFK